MLNRIQKVPTVGALQLPPAHHNAIYLLLLQHADGKWQYTIQTEISMEQQYLIKDGQMPAAIGVDAIAQALNAVASDRQL